MRRKERITDLTVTREQAMSLLSEDNMGAMSVLYLIFESGGMRSLNTIFMLDSAGIYGAGIWILWKYIADLNLEKFEDVLNKHRRGEIKSDLSKLTTADMDEKGFKLITSIRREMGWPETSEA